MNAADFKAAWELTGDELCRFSVETTSGNRLPEKVRQFLASTGLPREAAPCLSFSPGVLDWLRRDDLDLYFLIGTDGSGDPLVVDKDGIVWLLDHEAPERKIFVNSSVLALAYCLLAYRSLVIETITTQGEDAFLNALTSKNSIEELFSSLSSVDAAAVRSGTLWGQEIFILLSEANA